MVEQIIKQIIFRIEDDVSTRFYESIDGFDDIVACYSQIEAVIQYKSSAERKYP